MIERKCSTLHLKPDMNRSWLDPPPGGWANGIPTVRWITLLPSSNCAQASLRGQVIAPKQPAKNRKSYREALAQLAVPKASKDADAFVDARRTIVECASSMCAQCRQQFVERVRDPSTARGACNQNWKRLKETDFSRCGTCGSTRANQANHGASFARNAQLHKACTEAEGKEAADRKYPAAERKLAAVSACYYWAVQGGVAAQNLEAAKCSPLCAMCHMLDPSSNSANCNRTDPAKLKRADYSTERKFDKAKRQAGYRKEKRDYVNSIKRRIGACERLDCPQDGPSHGVCKAECEQCYDWDHQEAATKEICISQILTRRNCPATSKPQILHELGLPANFDAATDTMPPRDERRCQLLCRNCHMTRAQWDTGYDGYR